MLLDRPRQEQLAYNNDQFNLNLRRARGGSSPRRPPTGPVLETLISREFYDLEMTTRYQAARAQTTLPTP